MFANLRTLAAGAALIAGAALAPATADEIVVGGKNFTEQQLLTAMTEQLLAAKGFEVDSRGGMGSAAVRQAMENGQIDVYWEYTGTSLITYNKVDEKLGAQETYDRVRELDAAKGIVWLDASAANNTYALAMRSADAAEKGIATLSDLAAQVNADAGLTLASNAEWYARPDGLRPMQEHYGFAFERAEVSRMDSGLVYEALRGGDVDVGLVFATDGRIPAFDFVVLQDDKAYFPAYALAPTVRAETLEAHPAIAGHLNALSAVLDDATMARLNARVDVERVSIENVAQEFLTEQGLI